MGIRMKGLSFYYGENKVLDEIDIIVNTGEHIDAISSRLSKSHAAAKLQKLTDEQRAWLLVQMVCVEDLRAHSLLSEAIWL